MLRWLRYVEGRVAKCQHLDERVVQVILYTPEMGEVRQPCPHVVVTKSTQGRSTAPTRCETNDKCLAIWLY